MELHQELDQELDQGTQSSHRSRICHSSVQATWCMRLCLIQPLSEE
jgi:hypothetical protein